MSPPDPVLASAPANDGATARGVAATPPTARLLRVAEFALRTAVGWHFAYEGLYKLQLPGWTPDGTPIPAWSASGFLRGATGPFAGSARALADGPALALVDRALPFGLVAIGLALILGVFTRVSAIAALAFLLSVYVLSVPTSGLPRPGQDGAFWLVNPTLIEAAAALLIFAFAHDERRKERAA